jgi:hypothetical protein
MNIDPTALVSFASSTLGRLLDQTAAKGGVIPSDPTLDPVQVLKDLRLPPNLQQSFKQILTALGFEMDECMLDLSAFDEPRSAHQFWMTSGPKLFLIYIPNWILERNSETDRMAVNYIRQFFPTEARIYLISEEVTDLKMAFMETFKTWRLQGKINVILIRWSKFKEMQAEASQPTGVLPAKRQSFLRLVFELDQLPEDGPQAAKIDLTPKERQQLVDIFVSQASAAPQALGVKGYFISLIKTSNLPKKWQTNRIAALSGDPENDARDLINWAVTMGRNTDRPSYSVLAELLEVLMDSVGSDQVFISKIILTKPLLFDENAKQQFCIKYPVKIE